MAEKAEATAAVPAWRLETWFSDISSENHNKFKALNAQLQKHNRVLNLVSAKTLPLADVIHFADCILASRLLFEDNPKIDHLYDFGSGAGFPGLIAATLFPKVKFTLIDMDIKKCEFLNGCADEMKLKNVSVVNTTIENIPVDSVRYAVTRGILNISKTMLITRKCVVTKGVLYHMKSEQWGLEVSQIPTQLCSVWSPSLVKEYKLPVGEVRFALLRTEKN